MSDVSDEDDDLPVLTQVLRVGSGPAAAGATRPLRGPGDLPADAVAESSLDEILLADQLVIGTEPHVGLEPYIPRTTPLSEAGTLGGGSHSLSPTSTLIVPVMEPLDTPTRPHGDSTAVAASGVAATGLELFPAAIESGAASSDSPTDSIVASFERTTKPPLVPAPEADAFAARVRESVLNDLAARIDTEFDARVAHALRTEVETALASLQANLREQLAGAVRDVVRRAVEDEMARLQDHTRREPGGG